MTPTSILLNIVFLFISFNNISAKPKPKSNPAAEPEAWDWQNEPHHKFRVFTPFPIDKVDEPSFMKINRNISVVVGETAYLPCRVKNLDRHTVSWLRARDVKVLSVGHLAFSSDSRIGVVQVERPRLSASDWNLSIQNSTKADDGLYECQVNTREKINYKVFLTVSDPSETIQKDSPYYEVIEQVPLYEQTHSVMKKHHNKIEKEGFSMFLHDNGCICPKPEVEGQASQVSVSVKGGPVFYSLEGGSVELECWVTGLTSPPQSIVWRQDSDLISARGQPGTSLDTLRQSPASHSTLYISDLRLTHTGNYSCHSDGHTQTVLLVVTRGSQQNLPLKSEYNSGNLPTQTTILSFLTFILFSAF